MEKTGHLFSIVTLQTEFLAMAGSRNEGFSLRFFLFHPVAWFLFATCMLIFIATSLWEQHHERVVDHGRFRLSRELLKVSPPPVWLEQPMAEALDELIDTKKSLLDYDMVPVARQFADSLPWVSNVNQIVKGDGGLALNVSYRMPIALVDPIKSDTIPVDSDGVVFDASLMRAGERQQIDSELIRINMPWLETVAALPWHSFSDHRVKHGAQLAEFLQSNASSMGLYRIVTYDRPSRLGNEVPQWEAWTPNRTKIFWGAAPGAESTREGSASSKLAALEEFVAKFGQLKEFDKRNSLKIDVSTGTAVLIKAARIAELDNWTNTIK